MRVGAYKYHDTMIVSMGLGITSIVILMLIPLMAPAFAYPHIGIQLSDTCLKLQEAGMPSKCPTYKELLQLDNSVQEISGIFSMDENGLVHRETPQFSNSYNHFAYSDYGRIFIDPPHSTIPIITIQPNFDVYTPNDDQFRNAEYEDITIKKTNQWTNVTKQYTVTEKTSESFRVVYHDRYIEKCWDATLNADAWKKLIAETIFFMRNGCDKKFSHLFDAVELIPMNRTEFDITETRKYQHDKFVSDTIKNCTKQYGVCTGD